MATKFNLPKFYHFLRVNYMPIDRLLVTCSSRALELLVNRVNWLLVQVLHLQLALAAATSVVPRQASHQAPAGQSFRSVSSSVHWLTFFVSLSLQVEMLIICDQTAFSLSSAKRCPQRDDIKHVNYREIEIINSVAKRAKWTDEGIN